MYKYRVAFMVNGKQLNAWFGSDVEYNDDPATKARFREMAQFAVQEYLREARSFGRLDIWGDGSLVIH